MLCYEDDYKKGVKYALCKLFMESYIDLALAASLSLSSMMESESALEFFKTVQDFTCSILAIICMKLIISLPLYVFIFVCKYQEEIEEKVENDEVKGLLVEYVMLPQLYKLRAFYHFFFLIRMLLIVIVVITMVRFPFF